MNEVKHNVILLEQTTRLLFEVLKQKKFKKRKLKIIEDEYMNVLMLVVRSVFKTYEDYKRTSLFVKKDLNNFIEQKQKEFEA
jgi:hypothetical protein|tara:strand:- start:8155 stop:8400 length:246 start_codon:yes stop_codon:yes gene_type:complete